MKSFVAFDFSHAYNPTHYSAISRRPFEYWDNWRKNNPGIKPDLSHTVIDGCSFGNNFTLVNFKYAKLINFQ